MKDRNIDVELANPNKTKAISPTSIETDKLGARILASLLMADLIDECYILVREARRVMPCSGRGYLLSKYRRW